MGDIAILIPILAVGGFFGTAIALTTGLLMWRLVKRANAESGRQ